MTIAALIAETPTMNVVLPVTGNAIGRRIMKRRGRMALIARNVSVCAQQRKFYQVVVEPRFRSPTGSNVAICACRTQLPLAPVVK